MILMKHGIQMGEQDVESSYGRDRGKAVFKRYYKMEILTENHCTFKAVGQPTGAYGAGLIGRQLALLDVRAQ